MSRRTIVVDKKKLQSAINEAETNGPLKNLSALYTKVEKIYNGMDKIAEPVTMAVVGLRIKEFKLKHVTVAGKKGRAAGFGGGNSGPRVTKAEKFKESKRAQKALKALREVAEEDRFMAIIDRIEAGSRAAAVKLKCIECCGYQPSEVKKCACYHCPLFLFRPYKEGEKVELELEEAITK